MVVGKHSSSLRLQMQIKTLLCKAKAFKQRYAEMPLTFLEIMECPTGSGGEGPSRL